MVTLTLTKNINILFAIKCHGAMHLQLNEHFL